MKCVNWNATARPESPSAATTSAAESFMLDRRDFLATAGAGLGAAFLAARPEDIDASLRAASARPPLEVLTSEQAADIQAVAALIIPSDDLPGAHEAGVLNFADPSLATWAQDQKPRVIDGLT